jgi:hypothetical protein
MHSQCHGDLARRLSFPNPAFNCPRQEGWQHHQPGYYTYYGLGIPTNIPDTVFSISAFTFDRTYTIISLLSRVTVRRGVRTVSIVTPEVRDAYNDRVTAGAA